MQLAETAVADGNGATDGTPTGEPAVTSPFEHLMAGSHGVISKRIDLALLEGQELFSRSIARAALAGAGAALAAVAWFAGAAALVLCVAPDAGLVVRLAAFGLLNGAGALGLVALAVRYKQPPARVRPNGNKPAPPRDSSAGDGRN